MRLVLIAQLSGVMRGARARQSQEGPELGEPQPSEVSCARTDCEGGSIGRGETAHLLCLMATKP